MKQISIDALNNQLFETIEMLKNNNDGRASDNEKIDNDTAKVIANLGKVIIDGYKVKAQVLGMMNKVYDFDPNEFKKAAIGSGLSNDNNEINE